MLNLDDTLNRLGVKYIYLTSDYEFKEQIDRDHEAPYKKYFCELSWGTGIEPADFPIDFATNASGDTPGEAIQNCINILYTCIKDKYEPALEVARLNKIEVP